MLDINNPPQEAERMEKAHTDRQIITCAKCHHDFKYVRQCLQPACPLRDDGK